MTTGDVATMEEYERYNETGMYLGYLGSMYCSCPRFNILLLLVLVY